MQQQYPNKTQSPDEDETLNLMELEEDEDEDEDEYDDGEDPDEETEKFLEEAEDLFRLSPAEFQKRMASFDTRDVHENDSDDEDDDEDRIDRATERIPKKRLLKLLGELDPSSALTGKNDERMPNASLSTFK